LFLAGSVLAIAVVPDSRDYESQYKGACAVLKNLLPVFGNVLDGVFYFDREPVGLKLATGDSIHENPL